MPRYFEFDVALQEIQPRIWRRFLLRTTSSFAHLHMAIQESFGWKDYLSLLNTHPSSFSAPSERLGGALPGAVTSPGR